MSNFKSQGGALGPPLMTPMYSSYFPEWRMC